MSYVLSVFPSGRRARLLVLVIMMAVLGAAVFAGTRLGGAPPGVEAAPAAAPNAQVNATAVYIQFTVDGNTLEGDVTSSGFDGQGWSSVYSFSVSASTPRDYSGALAGRSQVNPITVTKAVDKSSPLLFEALTDNQVVDAEIKVIRADPSGTGAEEEVLHYTLTGGAIVGHRINVNDIPTDPPQFETETLSLSFGHLEMEWVSTGAVATWDWLR